MDTMAGAAVSGKERSSGRLAIYILLELLVGCQGAIAWLREGCFGEGSCEPLTG